MREKVVEQGLVRAVKQSGGLALKLVPPGLSGVSIAALMIRIPEWNRTEMPVKNHRKRTKKGDI